jgi:hypothetical protein
MTASRQPRGGKHEQHGAEDRAEHPEYTRPSGVLCSIRLPDGVNAARGRLRRACRKPHSINRVERGGGDAAEALRAGRKR